MILHVLALAATIVATPQSGTVRVRPAGAHGFAPLGSRQAFAPGATFDTRRGTVRLVTGKSSWGVFSGSRFTVGQNRSGLTTLTLVGGRSEKHACGALAAARADTPRPKVLRTLRAHVHGRFRTRGRYSAATVRGTSWDVSDECFSTRTIDHKGSVQVSNGFVARDLRPGESSVGYCFPPKRNPKSHDYCISVLSNPRQRVFGFGIGVRQTPANYPLPTTYELCVQGPSGTDRCNDYPIAPYKNGPILIGSVSCVQDEGPGTYVARWRFNGKRLGIPLTFTATRPHPDLTIPCLA